MSFRLKVWLCAGLFMSTSFSWGESAPEEFSNPILSGFHPDPSITRVGDTYYITNSTFEWFPALPIHKSKDLVNWELIGYGIDRPSQLNLQLGLRDSLGIFAPSIRHHNGLFYIITTCVGCGGNFYITAKNPKGPWSDPIWLKGAVGIDPSLFWDDDGRAYYTGAGILDQKDKGQWPGKGGVWMQEIDLSVGKLIGDAKQLTFGHASNARWAEGPHLFKINGEYLLLIGEGGTNEFHAVTVFNSKSLWGPYVANHANPVLTHRHLLNTYPITQTGHADLVQTQHGDWWSVMLAKRPIDGVSILSRETFLAKVEMATSESGVTPIFNPGRGLLQLTQTRPALPWTPVPTLSNDEDFSSGSLGLQWNSLRTPTSNWSELGSGRLRLSLRADRVEDLADPSFVARRVQHHDFEVTTQMTFEAQKPNETAGLVLYRRSTNHYQLLKEVDHLVLIKTNKYGEKGETTRQEVSRVPYSGSSVILQVKSIGNHVQFSYGQSESELKKFGTLQDISIISDEVTQRFNGAYIGMYATSNGESSANSAHFDWFNYKGVENK